MPSRCRPSRPASNDLLRRTLIAALALAGVAATTACASTGAQERSPSTAGAPPATAAPVADAAAGPSSGNERVGTFVAECPFSHRSPDDPIVHPHASGHTVADAHSHDFYGNTATDAHSTPQSLLQASTTCNLAEDLSSYWTPTLSRNGAAVTAEQFAAYYDAAPGIDPAAVAPIPAGLVMIAGNGPAIGVPPVAPVAWSCGRGGALAAAPPSCSFRAPLTLHIAFPDCWDGQHLDSADHRSHVAYATGGRCPPSHATPIVRLLLQIRYPIYGDPSDLTLSSGAVGTAHADFMNAWTETGLREFTDLCIRRRVICGTA